MTEIQKRSLLSLLVIIPFIFPIPILLIFSFIGGYNVGKLINLILKK